MPDDTRATVGRRLSRALRQRLRGRLQQWPQRGAGAGEFRKNVPTYLADRQYATGWDDGFRQCQASVASDFQRRIGTDSKADRDWRHARDQDMGKALGRTSRD